jgi:protein-S-isoprenylcysteine O-methyltransferase Ste14
LVIGGLSMLVWTVVLFDKIGQGTLGAGSVMGEPVNLVVSGPYRYVRNPMITGVASILLGEAALAGSGWLLIWFGVFCLLQTVAIRFWEEPHLTKRFGNDYIYYTQNVPRWIPRTAAWTPPLKAQ